MYKEGNCQGGYLSSPYFLTHTVFTNELSPLRKETNIRYAFMVWIFGWGEEEVCGALPQCHA